MQDTFRNLGIGLILAVAADLLPDGRPGQVVRRAADGHARSCRSAWSGILPMLYLTGTAINVQSLLGVIFIVGIEVSNTVLMTDFAQELRHAGGPDADRGDPQGGVDPRPAGDDDGPGGVLRPDPGGPGPGAGQRGQRPARPRHPRRPARRRATTLFVLPCLYSLVSRIATRAARNSSGRPPPALPVRAPGTAGRAEMAARAVSVWRGGSLSSERHASGAVRVEARCLGDRVAVEADGEVRLRVVVEIVRRAEKLRVDGVLGHGVEDRVVEPRSRRSARTAWRGFRRH